MKPIVVTGTDTGIGKTVFAAGLTAALNAHYWKPVQSGLEEASDSEIVQQLSAGRIVPEAYRLQLPASPHLSAEAEDVEIDMDRLQLPDVTGPLVVEGAGGIMVPLTRQYTFLDLFQRWQVPVILVARTSLGTINHSLLSLKALRDAGCTVAGIAFSGNAEPDVEQTICDMGKVRSLGRLPTVNPLNKQTLQDAFKNIDVEAVRSLL